MTPPRSHPGNQALHLNGATIMTTPTDTHIRIARDTGYVGVEVRAERLLDQAASDELDAAAALVRYWTEDPIDVARRGLALTEQVIGPTAPS